MNEKQNVAIQNLLTLANINRHDATAFLSKHDYNLDRTLRLEWDRIPKRKETTQLESIFNKYKDPEGDDIIGIDGTVQFITDLGLELSDTVVLAIAMTLNAEAEGEFTKLGFIFGWSSLGATSIPEMKTAVAGMKKQMSSNPVYFKSVYRFTYSYILPPNTRSLPLESAVAYWDLLLAGKFDKLADWNDFIANVYKKSISKDTWNMVLEFANYLNDDPALTNYDLEASWPSVIDEFVDHLKEKSA